MTTNDYNHTASEWPTGDQLSASLASASMSASAALPAWYTDALLNEYRSLMQRLHYLRRVLGIRER